MLKFQPLRKHIRELTAFLILISLSIGLLLFAGGENVSFRPKKAGLDFLSVCQRGITGTGRFISGTINSISELRNVKKEYSALLDRVSEYSYMEKNYAALERENTELKKQLGYLEEAEGKMISATVIGGNTNNFFKSLVINRGSSSGIEKNMAVIAYAGGIRALVGKVVETGTFSSVVKPITDYSLYVPGRLRDLRYQGLVNGNRTADDDTVFMNYVKKGAGGRIGYEDVVVTSGLNGSYPEDIYIGKVKSISSKEYETSLMLELEPFVDFARLEYVFVLTKGEKQDEK